MEYSVNKYNLIIKYEDGCREEIEYITGFKNDSNIIYNEPDKNNFGKNGIYVNPYIKGSIQFYLRSNSSSINTLSKLERKSSPFIIQIVNGNESSDIKISGSSVKIYSRKNNTDWIIEDFSEDYVV